MEVEYLVIFGSFLGVAIIMFLKDTLCKILRFCKGFRLD